MQLQKKDENEAYETCVLCGEKTDYLRNTPVDERVGYVIGCGQLCKQCYAMTKDPEE